MTLPTCPLTTASSSLTTIHNIDSNSSSSDPTLRILHTHGIPISFGLENGFTFDGTYYGFTTLGTRFLLFLTPDSLRRSVSDAPRRHRQSRSVHIRSQPTPYASNNNGNNGHASVLSPTVTFLWRYYSSFFLLPPNVDFHTGQQQQFLNPSQVRHSASQLHNRCLLSAAGSIFFTWSGVTLWPMLYFSNAAFSDLSLSRCLLLFISPSSNPPSFCSSDASSRRISSGYETKKNEFIFLYLFFCLL